MNSIEVARFRAKYTATPGGCWEWTAGRHSNGYGAFWSKGSMRGAHRVSWEYANGPVPEGLELDHLCRNRICVNPAHLEPVTRAENTRRGVGPTLAAARERAKTHCPKGHPYSGENLLTTSKCRYCRTCRRASARKSNQKRRQR